MMLLREKFPTENTVMILLRFMNRLFMPNHVMSFCKSAITRRAPATAKWRSSLLLHATNYSSLLLHPSHCRCTLQPSPHLCNGLSDFACTTSLASDNVTGTTAKQDDVSLEASCEGSTKKTSIMRCNCVFMVRSMRI